MIMTHHHALTCYRHYLKIQLKFKCNSKWKRQIGYVLHGLSNFVLYSFSYAPISKLYCKIHIIIHFWSKSFEAILLSRENKQKDIVYINHEAGTCSAQKLCKKCTKKRKKINHGARPLNTILIKWLCKSTNKMLNC